MSEQRDEHIKALVGRFVVRRRREIDIADLAESSRRGRLLRSEPDESLPDVPLHKRGFGSMDEDAP